MKAVLDPGPMWKHTNTACGGKDEQDEAQKCKKTNGVTKNMEIASKSENDLVACVLAKSMRLRSVRYELFRYRLLVSC